MIDLLLFDSWLFAASITLAAWSVVVAFVGIGSALLSSFGAGGFRSARPVFAVAGLLAWLAAAAAVAGALMAAGAR